MRPIGQFCPDWKQKIEEPILLAQWARTARLTKFSQWLKARWAHISHLARRARTGSIPSVIPISLWLMAQWAHRLHSAQWAHEGRYPSVNLISLWLMASGLDR